MKVKNLEGVCEIKLETACGAFPVEIREYSLYNGVLTLSLNIDQGAAEDTTRAGSIEADERRKAQAELEAHADLDASLEFGDTKDATIL